MMDMERLNAALNEVAAGHSAYSDDTKRRGLAAQREIRQAFIGLRAQGDENAGLRDLLTRQSVDAAGLVAGLEQTLALEQARHNQTIARLGALAVGEREIEVLRRAHKQLLTIAPDGAESIELLGLIDHYEEVR